MDTETFVVALPASVTISATAQYLGTSSNTSDWSVQLFRSTWWGADEAKGPLHSGRVGETLNFSVSLDIAPSASFYLRFRNASQYEPIRVTYSVTR